MRPFRALLALALVAAAPAIGLAQSATGTVEVLVSDGGPVKGALVTLEGPSGGQRRTDARGRVVFVHLRPGDYRVSIETARGTEDDEIRLSPGELRTVTFDCSSGEARVASTTRRWDAGVTLTDDDLRGPRPSDVWSALRDVPGVVADRVNVGGSDSAFQSVLVARGDTGTGASWSLDGVDVGDPAALGASTLFLGLDALDGVQARTSALDVRVRTPGVQVGLHLREAGRRGLSGRAHVRGAGEALQADNLPPSLADRPFLRNRTRSLLEAGAELGGRPAGGRLWIWGAASHHALRQQTFTEHDEEVAVSSFMGKARLNMAGGDLSLVALRNEKVHRDRDSGLSAAPEARWRQSGPTVLLAAEHRATLGRASVLARLAWLDAGFRLLPQGGPDASPFEDFRGVSRGSTFSFETSRPRLQAGLEAAASGRWLGFDHRIVGGAAYRRSLVETSVGWPGNKVLGLERQSVFFRTFRLTGFALPTRDQHARSLQEHVGGYAQDWARRGRLGLTLGLRLDRLSGRNLASAVGANPLVPDLLPAVAYAGGGTTIRWVDVLPRLGVSWDLTPSWRIGGGYAAYGPDLGPAEVTFDNPIGREVASLTYFWLDRNGDHLVQVDELDFVRGRSGASGVDPGNPASTASPHLIAPGLDAPRTHEVSGTFVRINGRTQAALHVYWRINRRPLWRPLRGLTLADYVIRGGVGGELFGRTYNVGYYAPASESRIVPGNGRLLANRRGYRQDAVGAELFASGRLGGRARWRVWGAFSDWREFFTDLERAVQDPTSLDTEPLQDAGQVAVRTGGLGRGDVFVSARWSGGAAAAVELPAALTLAGIVRAREGFPIPYFEVASTGDPTGGSKNVLVSEHVDSFRLPPLVLLDARLERGFRLGRGRLTVGVDAFNLLNRATTLQVSRDVELPAFNRPREIVRPRLLRLGLDYRF